MPYAPVGEREVYYELHGSGPPLVLVMGLGVDHRAWVPLLPLFAGFTTLIFDNAGVGATRDRETGLPPEPPYSVPRFADDLAGLLRHLELGSAHVVGVSMGGAIAMELAWRAPELLRSLTLVATWQRTDGWLRRIFAFRERLLADLGAEALLSYVSLWAWASPYWEDEGIAVTSTEQLISQTDTQAWDEGEAERYLGHLRAAIEHDCEERLSRITAPTLVVVGDEDVLTPVRFARALAARIPGARLEIVPAQGHAFSVENPELFASIVRTFVTRRA